MFFKAATLGLITTQVAFASTRTGLFGDTGLEYANDTGIATHNTVGLCKNRQFQSANANVTTCKSAYSIECLHNEMVFKAYSAYLVDLRALSTTNVLFNSVNMTGGYSDTNCPEGLSMTTVTDSDGDSFYRYSFLLDSSCGTTSDGSFSGSSNTSTWTYSNRLTLNTTNYKDIRAVPFECSYSTNYTLNNKEGYLYKFIDLQIKDAGTFEIELTSYAQHDNVTITEPINPTQEVIYEITSTSTDDSSRIILLERCYLTEFDPSDITYAGQSEVDLITNGCSAQNLTIIDNNYKSAGGQTAKFRSQIFSVEQNFEQAFVTCDIRFCDSSSCTDPSCGVAARRRRSTPDHIYHAPVAPEVHNHHVAETRARRDIKSHTLQSINDSLKVSFGMFKNGGLA